MLRIAFVLEVFLVLLKQVNIALESNSHVTEVKLQSRYLLFFVC